MNFLQMVQSCCTRSSWDAPSSINKPRDALSIHLKSLFNVEIKELLKFYDWSFLQKKYYINKSKDVKKIVIAVEDEHTIVLSDCIGLIDNAHIFSCDGIINARVTKVESANVITIDASIGDKKLLGKTLNFVQDRFPVPFDYQRTISRTTYSGNRYQSMGDPISVQQAARRENFTIMNASIPSFRKTGHGNYIFQTYGDSWISPISFYYISKFPVIDKNGDWKEYLEYDDDECLFEDELLIKGAQWRFKQEAGQDYSVNYQDYQQEKDRSVSEDSGMRVLNAGGIDDYYPVFSSYSLRI